MTTTATPPSTTARPVERRRGVLLGLVAGTIGIGCCVAPVVLVLLGLASGAAAVDLGNRLYGDWGWAFRGAAIAFTAVALVVQRRRAAACPADARPDVRRTALWLAGVGVLTYGALYGVTKLLASFA